jgi:hypothetical protein
MPELAAVPARNSVAPPGFHGDCQLSKVPRFAEGGSQGVWTDNRGVKTDLDHLKTAARVYVFHARNPRQQMLHFYDVMVSIHRRQRKPE